MSMQENRRDETLPFKERKIVVKETTFILQRNIKTLYDMQGMLGHLVQKTIFAPYIIQTFFFPVQLIDIVASFPATTIFSPKMMIFHTYRNFMALQT